MVVLEKFVGPKPENIADLNVKIQEAIFFLPRYWQDRMNEVKVIITDLDRNSFENRFAILENADKLILYARCDTDAAISELLEVADTYLIHQWGRIFLSEYPRFRRVIYEQAKPVRDFVVDIDVFTGIATPVSLDNMFLLMFPPFILRRDSLVPPMRNFLARIDCMVKYGHLTI